MRGLGSMRTNGAWGSAGPPPGQERQARVRESRGLRKAGEAEGRGLPGSVEATSFQSFLGPRYVLGPGPLPG